MRNTFIFSHFILIGLFALGSCGTPKITQRASIDLAGQWQFALDTADIGIRQEWYLTDLTDSIRLPGTTDSNQKGFRNRDTTTLHLSRLYRYQGAAWYRKTITVPESYRDQHVRLILERTKSSTLWIDGDRIGGSRLLQSPQEFDVSEYLTPGVHHITIRIDNSLKLTPYGNVHIYSDHTQTNWNGILGRMFVEASPKTYISNLQVFPDIENQKITVELDIDNGLNLDQLDIGLAVEKTEKGKAIRLKPYRTRVNHPGKIKLEYPLGSQCSLWDEHEQPLYTLTAVISGRKVNDSRTVTFGMRKFAIQGTQFAINGKTTFLRGKHDGGIFPLTGHPPMEVDGWLRVYAIAKSYGINHYRFHSYCPPEAAFTAADRAGIYLQVELPFWGSLKTDSLAEMLKEEGLGMLHAYANHPSFVLFSHGNEIGGNLDRVDKNLALFKAFDNRPLYTMGSNNDIGYAAPTRNSEYFVGARTPSDEDTPLTHTRLTQAFVDSDHGGILNTRTPSTDIRFDYPVSQLKMPVISHEVGQYQIYPDYREIKKYTGVLKALNLEVFRQRLEMAGMEDEDSAFQKASGAWSALCYKAEMEAAIRTAGLAGFQLLDLQDYPGQGTALVGILDAFMDSKGVITPEAWRQSCDEVVLLPEFPKYVWTTDETFRATVVVANYSGTGMRKGVRWEIINPDGTFAGQGTFPESELVNGKLTTVGEIRVNLSGFSKASRVKLSVSIPGTAYIHEYPLWIYPSDGKKIETGDILVAQKLDKQVLARLEHGGKVLLFPRTEDVRNNSVPGLFPPDFWNYGMFRGISERLKKPVSPGTLGILTRPDHPLFSDFPTDFHTNWQWFSIIKASHSLILDRTPKNYRPIVQVIDNLERNHKLGLILECKAGKGKLLVCMSPLDTLTDRPEAVQLYRSIITYMNSGRFDPAYEMGPAALDSLFHGK